MNFCIKALIGCLNDQAAVGDLPKAAPFECGAQCKSVLNQLFGFLIALFCNGSRILVFNYGLLPVDLLYQHECGLQYVGGLKSGNHNG